jgi:uncharacterized protein
MHNITARTPWYKQRWPWLLAVMPFSSIIVGFAFLWVAITSDDGLVSENYYQEGLDINKVIERDQAARHYNLGASGQLSGTEINLLLVGNLPTLPDSLRLTLIHPTRKGLDQSILLTRDKSNAYSGLLKDVMDAHFDITLEPLDGAWRMVGMWRPARGEKLKLNPA